MKYLVRYKTKPKGQYANWGADQPGELVSIIPIDEPSEAMVRSQANIASPYTWEIVELIPCQPTE